MPTLTWPLTPVFSARRAWCPGPKSPAVITALMLMSLPAVRVSRFFVQRTVSLTLMSLVTEIVRSAVSRELLTLMPVSSPPEVAMV